MQAMMTLMTVLAGMFFSLCCALVLEELLFGCLFRLFFGTANDASRGASPLGRATAGRSTPGAPDTPGFGVLGWKPAKTGRAGNHVA